MLEKVKRWGLKEKIGIGLGICVLSAVLFAPSSFSVRLPASSEVIPLFTITRSTNANTVHYDLRVMRDGKIQVSNPIDVYWLMHAEKGQRESLTWFEQKRAYGYSLKSAVSSSGFNMVIQAFDKRPISVSLQENGPRAEMQIDGKKNVLQNVYVKASGGMMPTVESIELTGEDPLTGKVVKELIRF